MGKKKNYNNSNIVAPKAEKALYKQYIKEEKYDKAIIELKKLMNRYKEDKSVIFDLALLYILHDIDYSEGILLFSKIRDHSNMYAIDYEIGKYYLTKGKFKQAESYFLNMLKSSFDNDVCKGLINLVKIYIRLDRFEEALIYYRELTDLSEKCGFKIPYQSNILFYLLYKTNSLTDEKRASYISTNYYARQVLNYDKEGVIENITKSTDPDNGEKLFMDRYSYIDRSIDITKLYDDCEKAIQDLEPCGYSLGGDYYYVPLDYSVGETVFYNGVLDDRKVAKAVEVFTLPKTKNILTIHATSSLFIDRKFDDRFDPKSPKTKKYTSNSKQNDIELPFTI